MSIQRSASSAETTLSELVGGADPGSTPFTNPHFVYITDLQAWYIKDEDDVITASDGFHAIRSASGTLWRRMAAVNGRVALFDDFLGDLLADEWAGAAGSDPQAVVPTILAGQVGGVVRLTSGDVGGGDDAVDASVLTSGLNWKATQGGLFMQARVKMSAITNVCVFVGFTDVSGTAEMPMEKSGSADVLAANAADACGLLFDTNGTTDVWGVAGVKATAVTTFQAGSAPVAATYDVIRVEVSTAGAVSCYLNGTLVATVANAVTPTVALTPVLAIMARTTTSHTLDGDYAHVEMKR